MKLYHDDISSSERDKYLSKGVLFVTVKPLFLKSPNFVKADIERAKLGDNNVNIFDEENDDDDDGEQPEWVDLVQPCADFHFESEFKYDDGGAD
jgi:hypothetical protein